MISDHLQLQKLNEAIIQIVKKNLHQDASLNVQFKEDKSVVTNIDLEISLWVHQNFGQDINYFSEESHGTLTFPALIVDPLDGTKQLLARHPECAFSMAFMHSAQITQKANWGYIFNPFTGFTLHSDHIIHLMPKSHSLHPRTRLNALVSLSEWNKGLFKKISTEIECVRSGSIVQKLGLLSAGLADCVISLAPKAIWDVAAGCLLLEKRGFAFYSQGKIVQDLDQELFSPPLIWCYPSDYPRISSILKL